MSVIVGLGLRRVTQPACWHRQSVRSSAPTWHRPSMESVRWCATAARPQFWLACPWGFRERRRRGQRTFVCLRRELGRIPDCRWYSGTSETLRRMLPEWLRLWIWPADMSTRWVMGLRQGDGHGFAQYHRLERGRHVGAGSTPWRRRSCFRHTSTNDAGLRMPSRMHLTTGRGTIRPTSSGCLIPGWTANGDG